MIEAVVQPPAETRIPITAGCGRAFTIEYRDTATAQRVNWPDGSAVLMHIDAAEPITVAAQLHSYNAAIALDAAVCDELRSNTRYRIVLDTGGLEIPLMVGRFVRFDG